VSGRGLGRDVLRAHATQAQQIPLGDTRPDIEGHPRPSVVRRGQIGTVDCGDPTDHMRAGFVGHRVRVRVRVRVSSTRLGSQGRGVEDGDVCIHEKRGD